MLHIFQIVMPLVVIARLPRTAPRRSRAGDRADAPGGVRRGRGHAVKAICHLGRAATLGALALTTPFGLAGCQRPYTVHDNPMPIDAEEYDRIFDAAVFVLRDKGFAIDRRDHRFGKISTLPLGAPTFAEPWHTTNTTVDQMAQSTINDEQRIASVFLEKQDPDEAETRRYQLRVEVVIERRQQPTRRLTGSTAPRRISNQLASVPHELKQRGIPKNYWSPVGRDPYLEQRLLADIINTSLVAADRGIVVPTEPQEPGRPRVDTTQPPPITDIPSDTDLP